MGIDNPIVENQVEKTWTIQWKQALYSGSEGYGMRVYSYVRITYWRGFGGF